jgi:hypothetical protein
MRILEVSFIDNRVPQALNQAKHKAHALSRVPKEEGGQGNESKYSTCRKQATMFQAHLATPIPPSLQI